jgi:hypothetical protein
MNISIATEWMNRIKAANPVLAAVALYIARQSCVNADFDTETSIKAKLGEWKIDEGTQTARALRFAVIYYQEDIRAKAG